VKKKEYDEHDGDFTINRAAAKEWSSSAVWIMSRYYQSGYHVILRHTYTFL